MTGGVQSEYGVDDWWSTNVYMGWMTGGVQEG